MSRFFPNGGNGSKPTDADPRNEGCYQVKPGSIKPLFDNGYLTDTVIDGQRYVKLTAKGEAIIKRVNK